MLGTHPRGKNYFRECLVTWVTLDRHRRLPERGRTGMDGKSVRPRSQLWRRVHAPRRRSITRLPLVGRLTNRLGKIYAANGGWNVDSWLQADIQSPEIEVRCTPNSRHHGGHPEPPWQARGYEVEMRPFETDFSLLERDLIARAAGRVFDAAQIDSPAAGQGRTARSRRPGYPTTPRARTALLARPQRPAESKRGFSAESPAPHQHQASKPLSAGA